MAEGNPGRNDDAQPHRAPRRAPDGRGRHRGLRARQAQGRAPGRAARHARAADERRDRRGAASLPGALSRGRAPRPAARRCASRRCEVMRELERFKPYLTGSVLNGNAGKYADINLQLFTDNAKARRALPDRPRHPVPRRRKRGSTAGEEPRIGAASTRWTTTASRSRSRCCRRDDCACRSGPARKARRSSARSARSRTLIAERS